MSDLRVMCWDCAEEFDPDFSPDVERCLSCVEHRARHEGADIATSAHHLTEA